MKRLLILLVFLVFPSLVHAREGWRDWCQMGNRSVVTSGLNSTTKVQQSFPQCTITIYVHGGAKAVIYNDNNGTIKANPFTSDTDGQFIWYADNGRYDQTTTGAGMPQPITMSDILLCDPVDAAGGSCGPAITPPAAGCTLSGVDTGVLSEHPVGTCYDSLNFTWVDLGSGTVFRNLQIGDGLSNSLSDTSSSVIIGDNSFIINTQGFSYAIGGANEISDVNLYNFVEGFSNDIIGIGSFVPPAHSDVTFCEILGNQNQVQADITGGSSGVDVSNCFIAGQFNSIYAGPGASDATWIIGDSNTVQSSDPAKSTYEVYVMGAFNLVTDELAVTDEVGIFGESNTVDGSVSTVQIFGFNNTAHNVTPQGFNNVNTAIAGSANLVERTAGTGVPAYASIFGHQMHVHDCTNCVAVGSKVQEATDNTMGVGMAQVPELVITAGNVKRSPVGVTTGPVIKASFVFGGIVTGNKTQTCTVAFTGGTGSGGTGILYLQSNANSTAGSVLDINAGGSYTVAPTGGTLTNGSATCSGSIVITAMVGLVPTCNSSTEGSFSAIVDSNTTTYGATITGGSSSHVFGYCNGTNWTVH